MANQQRKDLELVFSLQSHYKHFFKNCGDIVGVYDIPSITMQWESFKSYLLKNSGILFDNCQSYATAQPSTSPSQSVSSSCSSNSLQLLSNDIHIRFVNTSGIELPINTQEDFQYALYTFRERARAGEINHLKLTRSKGTTNIDDNHAAKPPKVTGMTTNGGISQLSIELNRDNLVQQVGVEVSLNDEVMFEVDTTTDDVDEGIGGHVGGRRRNVAEGLGGATEKPPEWFAKYMKKFKQEIIQEITKVNTTQMSSNLKKMQAANHVVCPKRRQNKSEHYKRRPKMSYSNTMAAMENTSCDNTDINTITTTPTISNAPQKLAENQQKSDNKQIKLKAKRLSASSTNMRGSSDSDTLTVIKTANPHNFSIQQAKKESFSKRTDKTLGELTEQHAEDFARKRNDCEVEAPVKSLNKYPSDEKMMKDYEDDLTNNAVEQYLKQTNVLDNQDCDDITLMEARVLREERNVCLGQVEGFEGPVYLQQWNLKNTGSKSWDDETEVCFAWGSIVPYKGKIPCPLLKPGDTGTVSLFYRIPDRAGTYECYCHLVHRGRRFGPWLGFKVKLNTSSLSPYDQPRAIITPMIPPLKPQSHKQYPYEQTQGRELYSSLLTLTRTYKNNNRGCELNRIELGPNDCPNYHVSTYTVDGMDCPSHHHQQQQDGGDEAAAQGVQIKDDGDDVVAVIQGVVVRVDGLVGDVDIQVKTVADGEAAHAAPLLPSTSFKRFKGNEQMSADEQDIYIMQLSDKHLRCGNDLHRKQQLAINKQLQLHTDSDDDEDSDYDNYYDDDVNVGKDLVMVDKHHLLLQNNSDSDNASIVSIPESVQSIAGAKNGGAASSVSSGHGSASEEFVVIPMPTRVACETLSDCEDDESCPELEPDPECYETAQENGKREEDNVVECREVQNWDEIVEKEESKKKYTESMTTANAPTFQNFQEQIKSINESSFVLPQQREYLKKQNQDPKQTDLTQSHYRAAIPFVQNFDCFRNEHVSQETIQSARLIDHFKINVSEKQATVVEKSKKLAEVADSRFTKSMEEQQTCPVDLSTNSSKADCVSDNSSELGLKKSQKSDEIQQHCAATLCDLCTNIIMKNKIENNKNRLFVFPNDSPGFEVFAPVNKNAVPKEHQIEIPASPQISKKPADVIIQKQTNVDLPVRGIWAVQEISRSPQKQQSPIMSSFKFVPQNNLTFDSPNLHNSTINSTCTFKSSLNLKKRDKDTFYDSSSSTDGSSFTCPSCQCDGLCWRYQGKTELDYRNHLINVQQFCDVTTAQSQKIDAQAQKVLRADEIRAQMRNLFVQLAELEPLKDPYLKVESTEKLLIEVDKTSKRSQMKIMKDNIVQHEDQQQSQDEAEIRSERAKIPLFMQRHLKDRKQASKKLRFIKSFSAANVVDKEKVNTEIDGKTAEVADMLADQFQTSLRLGDVDEPMPDVTNIANVSEPQAVRDVCSKGLPHTGCPYKTHLFLDHQEQEQPNIKTTGEQATIGKLIDVPSPEASFIERASAPVENGNQLQAATAAEDDESITHAMEQQRLIQLHCKDDADLGNNMRSLIDMGFPNFYFNLQLLKSNDNNIVLALEKFLPNF